MWQISFLEFKQKMKLGKSKFTYSLCISCICFTKEKTVTLSFPKKCQQRSLKLDNLLRLNWLRPVWCQKIKKSSSIVRWFKGKTKFLKWMAIYQSWRKRQRHSMPFLSQYILMMTNLGLPNPQSWEAVTFHLWSAEL